MDKYRIPQTLDQPFKIIIWTADEFLVFALPFLLCLSVLNAPLTGVTIGVACMLLLKKIKGEESHHYLLTLMYWYLPQVVRYQTMPASYLRVLLG
jgi:type IV conjugative transfer system protein TraL